MGGRQRLVGWRRGGAVEVAGKERAAVAWRAVARGRRRRQTLKGGGAEAALRAAAQQVLARAERRRPQRWSWVCKYAAGGVGHGGGGAATVQRVSGRTRWRLQPTDGGSIAFAWRVEACARQ